MRSRTHSDIAVVAWLLNPFTFAISTRGSCDSITVFGLLLQILALSKQKHFVSGLLWGINIHWRLFPVIYAPVILASLLSDVQLQHVYNFLSKRAIGYRETWNKRHGLRFLKCLCSSVALWRPLADWLFSFMECIKESTWRTQFYTISPVWIIVTTFPFSFIQSTFLWDNQSNPIGSILFEWLQSHNCYPFLSFLFSTDIDQSFHSRCPLFCLLSLTKQTNSTCVKIEGCDFRFARLSTLFGF